MSSFEFAAIDARRLSKIAGRVPNLRIDHNSTVTLITEMSEAQASVDFRFTANYRAVEEVVGIIRIEGHLVWEGGAKDLVRKWSSTGQMPSDAASEIHTVIMTNCIPEAVLLARELRLPPPIPIPAINLAAAQASSKTPRGMEVG